MKKNINILSYFTFRALFMGIGISKILITAKEYFIFTCIIGTLLGLFILYISNNKSNKYINILSNIILIIILLVILINMISTMYLTEMSRFFIGLPIILLIIYQLTKDSKNIYKVSNILFVFNIVLFIVANISLIKYINISNLSYTNTNKFNILTSSIEYAIYSIIPFLLVNDTDYKPYKTYIVSNITLFIWFMITYLILGSNLVEIYRYPEYIILKNVSITSAIENIENLICFMWIFDIYILMLKASDKIKKESNSYICSIILIIVLILTCFISTYYQIILSIYSYSSIILLILFILNRTIKNTTE